MSVGIYTSNYPYALIETVKRNQGARLHLCKARARLQGPGFCARGLSCRRRLPASLRTFFRENDLPIVAISCFSEPSPPRTPTRAKRKRGRCSLRVAARPVCLGRPMWHVMPGTYNAGNEHAADSKNVSEEGYQEFFAGILAGLVRYAGDHGAVFLLEPFINNVIGTIESSNPDHRRYRRCRNSGSLWIPPNYFEGHNVDRIDEDGECDLRCSPRQPHQDRACQGNVRDSRADPREKHSSHNPDGPHAFRGNWAASALPGPGQGQMKLRSLP